jgi:ribosomal protein L29
MSKNNLTELRAMDAKRLGVKAEELRRELFQLRLNAATSPSKSFAAIKNKLKKDIARTLTVLQEKNAPSLNESNVK